MASEEELVQHLPEVEVGTLVLDTGLKAFDCTLLANSWAAHPER